MVSPRLKKHIEENVMFNYHKNDDGHGMEHANYVIRRSLEFAKQVEGVNMDMVYAVASYHDVGHHIDANNHGKVSADMLRADTLLSAFFTLSEIEILAQAVEDHRASKGAKPRNVYGRIVSSADRSTNLDSLLCRTYAYRIKNRASLSLDEIIEESRQHVINKFGAAGYAREKMYFNDPEWDSFLNEAERLSQDPIAFKKRYLKVNNIC